MKPISRGTFLNQTRNIALYVVHRLNCQHNAAQVSIRDPVSFVTWHVILINFNKTHARRARSNQNKHLAVQITLQSCGRFARGLRCARTNGRTGRNFVTEPIYANFRSIPNDQHLIFLPSAKKMLTKNILGVYYNISYSPRTVFTCIFTNFVLTVPPFLQHPKKTQQQRSH